MRSYLELFKDELSLDSFGLEVAEPYGSLRMKNHHHPLSITPTEFDFVRELVAGHPISNAFEVATGFGISALAIAMGITKHRVQVRAERGVPPHPMGALVTMDAYVEEVFDHCGRYRPILRAEDPEAALREHFRSKQRSMSERFQADGLTMANSLASRFGVDHIVKAKVGWSPQDVPAAIAELKGLLDFVFLDGAHYDKDFLRDVRAVAPFLDAKALVVVHDVGVFSPETLAEVKERLGRNFLIPQLSRSYGIGLFYPGDEPPVVSLGYSPS